MKSPTVVQIWKTQSALENAAAKKILETIRQGLDARGRSVIALSGGETPRNVYNLVGVHRSKASIDWSRVHIFFCDERMVPPTDPKSNYGMIDRVWTSHLPIPQNNVHRIHGEKDPAVAAQEYERELNEVFAPLSVEFDFVLLGIGEDGHTASIFPGTDVVNEREALVKPVFVPRLESWRVTLTFPVLNAARELVFLAAGAHKASVVQRTLGTEMPDRALPASLIRPTHGTLNWMLDEKAGMLIKKDLSMVVERY